MENSYRGIRTPSSKQKKRPTIGLLLENTIGRAGYQADVWSGVVDAVREKDANLIFFAGGTVGDSQFNEFENQHSIVYDLAGANNIDGLIISGTLGTFIAEDEFREFINRYKDLSIVLTVISLPDVPSVMVDNEKGMREMLVHLIQDHSYRKIGFIRGPEHNPDAEQRYQAYKDVLTEQNIPFDNNLVVSGDFMLSSGALALDDLLKTKQMEPDVLIAANDNMALGALEALRDWLIYVPQQLPVVGFDDISGAADVTPSLTTVYYPAYEQGKAAADMLFGLLGGNKTTENIVLSTRLKLRESCGCPDPTVEEAKVGLKSKPNAIVNTELAATREKILADVQERMSDIILEIGRGQVTELLDTFYAELRGEPTQRFLAILDRVVANVLSKDGNVSHLNTIISSMRRNILPLIVEDSVLFHAEDLWQQARVMIGKRSRRAEGYKRLQAEQRKESLNEMAQELDSTSNLNEIMDILTKWLKQLGIKGCYLSLYENRSGHTDQCRSVLAYREGQGTIQLPRGAEFFQVNQLIPKDIISEEIPFNLIVGPLYYHDNQLGIVVFEFEREPSSGEVYETLRSQISSALWRARFDKYLRSLSETATVVAKASAQKELPDILNAIVNGTQEVFQCDAVTLYTYNSITNELGHPPITTGLNHPERAQLLNQVEKDSIVYKVLEKNEPYIVEIINQNDDFKNRRFVADENVKSCIGIPLEAGNQKVGVMFVNYRSPHRFTAHEVDDIRLFAYQAALSIRNAQYYQETRKTKYLGALYKAGTAVTSTLSLDEILERIVEQVRLITGSNGDAADLVHIGFIEGTKLQTKTWRSKPSDRPNLVTSTIDLVEDKAIGIMGKVAITGVSILSQDVTQDKDYLEDDPRTRSELAVPIMFDTKVIGVINAEHPDYGTFDKADQQYLQSLATQVAIAIQNAKAYENLKRAQGLIAGRTALAWMGMASSVWRHSADKHALTIRETAQLLRRDNKENPWFLQDQRAGERISEIEEMATQILNQSITSPLSSESGIEKVSLSALVGERTRQLWNNAPYKNIDLKLNLMLPESIVIRANSDWLQRAFDMLVDNSVKAIGDQPVRKMEINTRLGMGGAEILVSDNGSGMSQEIVQKIGLEAIEKPADAEGLGMGLLIAQAVVQTYGGNIRVESTGSTGTTMLISLPLEEI